MALFLCHNAVTLGGATASYVAVKAARVITVSGEEFAPGVIVIEDGKISAVGKDLEFPPSAKVIDARGQTVMPGLIHSRSRHGLPGYTRAGVQGDQTAASEVYPGWMDFGDLIEAGFTAVAFVPDGTDIPGTASVFRTAGPDASRRLADAAYLQVVPDWNAKGKENLRAAFKKAKEEIEKVDKARKEWEEKQKAPKEKGGEAPEKKPEEKKPDKPSGPAGDVPHTPDATPAADSPTPAVRIDPPKTDEAEPAKEEFKPPQIDPKYQPLVDLVQKKEGWRMMVQLTKASDLLHLDDVLKPYEGVAYVLYLATAMPTDYNYVARQLGERKAKVVLRPWIHRLPQTTFRYNLAQKLTEAGCEVSFIPFEPNRAEYLRLRSRIAELVRSGLPRKTAIESLTLNPARLLGIEKRLGSIEKGKDADLVFLDGDPLDPHSKVKQTMILGEIVWSDEKKP